MPESLSAAPAVDTYTHSTIGQAIQADINPKTNRITILFQTNPGEVAFSGTEGVALTAEDAFPVDADSPFTIKVDAGAGRVEGLTLFTQVSTQPTVVKIISELD